MKGQILLALLVCCFGMGVGHSGLATETSAVENNLFEGSSLLRFKCGDYVIHLRGRISEPGEMEVNWANGLHIFKGHTSTLVYAGRLSHTLSIGPKYFVLSSDSQGHFLGENVALLSLNPGVGNPDYKCSTF